MTAYRGHYQYAPRSGSGSAQGGGCQIQFDAQLLTLTPDAGLPLVVDLGDLEAVSAADYAIRLPLYTGATLTIDKVGKSYADLSRELLECYRKRTLECLLLADLQEIDRFTGEVVVEAGDTSSTAAPAEIRVFTSNLAVLPNAEPPFQWRLADVDAVEFDSNSYEIVVRTSGHRLRFSRLAKRTELFHSTLRDAVNALKAESGAALHGILPFLNADELRAAAGVLREGNSASIAQLAGVHRRIPDALAANAVDDGLRPYYDHLLNRTARGLSYTGFKMIRSESGDTSVDMDDDDDRSQDAALYWFFFPIAAAQGGAAPGNVVAWEASSRSGRATYFFRLVDPPDEAALSDPARASGAVERGIGRISRALGLLGYRRRPIYLSDDELTGQPAFRRYAIAARRIPELRDVRAAFLGRAIHSSLEAWRTQVSEILAARGIEWRQ